MIKTALLPLLFLTLTVLQGQNPNEQEIESVPETDFINFNGVHRQQDSRNDIYNIGVYLAKNIKQQQSDYYGKYTLTRSLTPGNETMFDADIIQLENRAGVDHVRNLRLIVAGYLATLYGIEAEQALTLATFISYYNVHYRGQLDYVKSKYKPEVLALLDPEKLGLSQDYREWAGRTQILIPVSRDTLLDVPPQPDLAETGQPAITNKIMQGEREERALELRRNMVEQRRENLAEKQDKLDQLSNKQQQQQQEVKVDRDKLNRVIQQSDSSNARKQAEDQLAQNEQTEQDNRRQQDRINRKQQQLSQQKDAVTKEENQLEQDSQASASDNPAMYFPLLATTPEGEHRLVRLSVATARITGQSDVQQLRSASLLVTDDAIFLISGKPTAHLTRVLPGNLKVDGISGEAVFPVAAIWRFDELKGIFTVIAGKKEGQWLLGQYDDALNLLAQSSEPILPYTSLRHSKGKLLLQNAAGRVIVLNGQTLAKEAEIKGP